MAKSRLDSLSSFFSSKLQASTAMMSEALSSENLAKYKITAKEQYDKCKKNVADVMESEVVCRLSSSVQDYYEEYKFPVKEKFDFLKDSICATITPELISAIDYDLQRYQQKVFSQCLGWNKKVNNAITSPRLLQVKSAMTDAIPSASATSYFIDVGMLMVPTVSPLYSTLLSTKYLIVSLVFTASLYQSCVTAKKSEYIHDNIGFCEDVISSAYHVNSELSDVLKSVEKLFDSLGINAPASSLKSDDFYLSFKSDEEKVNLRHSFGISNDSDYLTLVDIMIKLVVLHAIIQKGSLHFASNQISLIFKSLFMLASFINNTLYAYQHNCRQKKEEAVLADLQKKLEPVYSTLHQAEKKIFTDETPIKKDLVVCGEQASSLLGLFQSFVKGASNASEVHGLIEIVIPNQHQFKWKMSSLTFFSSSVRAYLDHLSQEEFDAARDQFYLKLQETSGLTGKMKKMLLKQYHYIEFLSKKSMHQKLIANKAEQNSVGYK